MEALHGIWRRSCGRPRIEGWSEFLNETLRRAILVGTVAAGIILSLLVFLYPIESADFINSVPVKFVLLFLCWLLVTTIAFLLFYLYYLPQPRRLVISTWRFMAGIGIVSSGASVLGFPRLVGGDLNPETFALKFWLEWQEAAKAATATVAVSLILLTLISWLYVYLFQWEKKHGRLTVQ